MHNKRLLIILPMLLVYFCHLVHGQKNLESSDVVNLADGSILVGKIIEDTDYLVRIIIETGDTLTIGYKKIVQSQNKNRREKFKVERTFIEGGYFAYLAIRSYLQSRSSTEVAVVLGKRISNQWNLGIALNYHEKEDFIEFSFINPGILNLGLYGRYNVYNGYPKIFIDGEAGYGFVVSGSGRSFDLFERNINGGAQGSLSAGVHFAGRKSVRWLVNAGVKYNDTNGNLHSFDQFNGEVFIDYTKKYLSPYFGVGIEF